MMEDAGRMGSDFTSSQNIKKSKWEKYFLWFHFL